MRAALLDFCRARWHLLALACIVGLALFLRLFGLNWDQGGLFHPDERAILLRVVDLHFPTHDLGSLFSAESPWNPRWFPYGSFPLYLLKVVGDVTGDERSLAHLATTGRVLNALFDTGTILLVYAVGARLFGRIAGLLGATLIAFAALHIQQSHFFVTDILQAALLMGSFYFLARLVDSRESEPPRNRTVLINLGTAGALFGLALATKVSSAPFALVFLVAAALYVQRPAGSGEERAERLQQVVSGFLLAITLGFVVLIFAEPYALLDWKRFGADVGEQGKMVRRILDYPYTRQYIGTTPYLYHIQQLAAWGVGLPAGIVLWAGLLWGLWKALARRSAWHLLVLAWVVPYFLITGAFSVKFLRYLIPLTPFLALLAGDLMVSTVRWLRSPNATDRIRLPRWAGPAACGLFTVVMVLTLLYAVAYARIYTRPHTAQAAATWMRANAAPNSILLKEHWEEGLPGFYSQLELELYNDDGPQKRAHIIQRLTEADYLIFYSNRLYATIPRLPDRYPLSTAYYQLMFSEQLGYKLVHWESSYPNLFGISLENDTFSRPGLPEPAALRSYQQTAHSLNFGFADESFTVYDHPLVLIFKKEVSGSAAQQRAAFDALLPRVTGQTKVGLVMTPEETAVQQAGGTWSELFDRASWVNRVPWLAWFLVVQLVFLITLPITLTVFQRLPDRGYLLGKMLGVLLVAYIPWLLASLHWMGFSRGSIALGMLGLAVLSGLLVWKQRDSLTAFVREQWRLIILCELVFVVAFAGMYAVRIWNPDLWHPYRGGEKPMDFAYFNAVVRSTYMPPYDPWYSGGFLNYYYFGQLMNATLTKFAGIVPSKAITLTTPLFFALTAAAAFSIVYNLAALVKGGKSTSMESESAARRSRLPSPTWAGLLAVLLVCIAGNLDGAGQVAQGVWRFLGGHSFGSFDYWRSSRLMPPDPPGFEITEFPYFSFLFADPHAHVFVIPLTLLAVGLALAIAIGTPAERRLKLLGQTAVLPLIVLGLTLGAILATNSWDVLAYALVSTLAVVIGEWRSRRNLSLAFWTGVGIKVAVLAVLAFLFFAPYVSHYKAATKDPDISLIGGALTLFAKTQTTTALWQYLAIHGLFIWSVVSLVGQHIWNSARGRPWRGAWDWVVYAGVALVVLGFAVQGYSTIPFLVALLGAAVGLIWHLLSAAEEHGDERGAMAFGLLLVVVALGIGIFVDLFVLNSPTEVERMNTVFKFYLQAWVLFGLAAAFALWQLNFGRAFAWRPGRLLWQGGLAILLIAVLLYPIMATPARARDRFNPLPPTTDGMAYMDTAIFNDFDNRLALDLHWDRLGIEWLQDNVEGSPVIVEGLTPLYRWGNRVSVYTGLPAVIGWDWHQKQQRWAYQFEVDRRRADVDSFYATADATNARNFLTRYNVSYVYVGQLERSYYPAAGIAKFEGLLDGTLERVYSNREVQIYRVTR